MKEKAAKKLKLSIVVASHRSQWIEELSERLLCQLRLHRSIYEIIIVTDYPNEKFHQKYQGITWVYYPDLSISKKRNEGIRKASGVYIAFTDDDCVPSLDWAVTGVEYLDKNSQIAGVEGRTQITGIPDSGRTITEYKRLEKRGYRTNNIFYRKADLIEAGLFDTRFSVQREDIDLAFTLISQGKKIDYSTGIYVSHRFRDGESWDLLKNCINRRFDPLLYKKHPRLYRQHIKTPFPITILLSFIIWVPLLLAIMGLNRYRLSTILTGISIVSLTIHRNGLNVVKNSNLFKEMISITAAPFILTAALIYGSIKHKKFLLL
jgi:glycosyltransferase involved in cell wall biosynthesis